MPRLRTLLILGRISNFPTVWSNCLAGWWLGGGGNYSKLPVLLAGTTLLYVGGTFLNDVFDVEFDRQHRPERPIASGTISLAAVRRLGLTWLALGAICLIALGTTTGLLGLLLLISILLYDAIHKVAAFSPVLLGLCRLLVYTIAAAVTTGSVNGLAVWCGLALAAYVTGLSFPARGESTARSMTCWPLLLLSVPILLALLLNTHEYRTPALMLSVLLALWTTRSIWPALATNSYAVGRAVSSLLAGIVFVDLLAVADLLVRHNTPHLLALAFPVLFSIALLLQRFVPAT